MLPGWLLVEFYLQTKIKGLYWLCLNIFVIFNIVFFILPKLSIGIINNNIEKNIEANVYLYTEVEIKKEWSQK